MAMLPKSETQRTKEYEERREAQGQKRHRVWCMPINAEKVRAYAEKLDAKTRRDMEKLLK